jgi:hypothetical protein
MVYRNAPELMWVQEAGHILVVNPATGAAQRLIGQEAAVWDWFNSGHASATVTHLLALAFDLAAPEAQAVLDQMLARWLTAGLVEDAERAHGESLH